MKVRAANINDLNNIANLHAQSWRENYQSALSEDFINQHLNENRLQVWNDRLTTPSDNQLVLVAEVDQVFSGFICAYGGKDSQFGSIIDNLHVMADKKGLGIGTELMLAATSWAQANYPEQDIYLEVLESNTKAIGYYTSLGGKKLDQAYWHTPCGNKVKEFIYGFGKPEHFISKIKQPAKA